MATVLQFVDGSRIDSVGVDLDATFTYTSPSGDLVPLPGLFLSYTSWGVLFKEELPVGYRLVLFSFERGFFYGPSFPGTVSQALELGNDILLTATEDASHRLALWRVGEDSWMWLSPPIGAPEISRVSADKVKIVTNDLFSGISTRTLFLDEIRTAEWRHGLPVLPTSIYRTATGAEYVLLGPPAAAKTLVSFHGGPESYELLENRYDGLYLELLSKGYSVLICNYSGSSGLGMNTRKAPWTNWEGCIRRDLEEVFAAISPQRLFVFGVSFGGALGLLTARHFDTERVFLSSPLLDLAAQSKRDSEMRSFFDTRFSDRDFSTFSADYLIAGVSCPVECIHALYDPIISAQASLEAQRRYSHFNLRTPPAKVHSLVTRCARKAWPLTSG